MNQMPARRAVAVDRALRRGQRACHASGARTAQPRGLAPEAPAA